MQDEYGTIVNKNIMFICRGCFCNQKELLQSFFDSPIILEMYVRCTDLQVQLDDGLPMNLCSSCVNKCFSWHTFKQFCTRNDTILRKNKLDISTNIPRFSVNTINDNINTDTEQKPIDQNNTLNDQIKEEELDLFVSNMDIGDQSVVNVEYNNEFLLENEIDVINEIIIEELNISDENVETQDINLDSLNMLSLNELSVNAGSSGDNNQDKGTRLNIENQQSMHVGNLEVEPKACTSKLKNNLEKQKQMIQFDAYSDKFNCNECGKVYSTQPDYLLHISDHNNKKSYKCALCGRILINDEYFIDHITKTHDKDIFLHCSFCKKRFLFKGKLKKHLRRHSREKSYECALCNLTFIKHDKLKKHVNKRHSKEKLAQCAKCNKSFFCKNKLAEHLRRHVGKKPFKCSTCEKSFVNKLNLVKHVRMHVGSKPFQCHLCKKTFSRKGYFDRHIKNHKSKKTFKCTMCDKCFSSKCALANHIQRHSVKQKHKCALCENSFKRKEYLTKHMRRHTNEKPYVCTLCGKSFAMNEYLVKHMRRKIAAHH